MPTVELIYEETCPKVPEARAQLLRAFARTGACARWQEWQSDDSEAPSRVQGYGSPTILVDGVDVAGAAPVADLRCCRLYDSGNGGLHGAPSVEAIAAALGRSAEAAAAPRDSGTAPTVGRERSRWKASAAMIPAFVVALLPKVACPACWPAYAGFLSAFGLGFLLDVSYLFPLTATFLALAVGALAFRARRRRGHGPFLVGLAAAAAVLIGKFIFESEVAMYAGLTALLVASIWNSWPRRTAEMCSACAPSPETA